MRCQIGGDAQAPQRMLRAQSRPPVPGCAPCCRAGLQYLPTHSPSVFSIFLTLTVAVAV